MPAEAPASPTHDAQRELEQRALRNVRALVDKIEGEESRARVSSRKVAILVVTVIAVLMVAFAVFGLPGLRQGPAQTIVLPPPSGTAR